MSPFSVSSAPSRSDSPFSSVRIATASREDPEDAHTADQVMENLTAALPAVVSRIEGQWDNIKSIGIKTSASIMLPIWTSDINSLHTDADEKVMSRAEKAVKRGQVDADDSDDSVMHNDSEDEPKSKKQKKAAPTKSTTPAKKTATQTAAEPAKPKSPAAGKTKAAAVDIPLPPAETAPAPAPAKKEQKKVMAGKAKVAPAAAKKNVAASAAAKVKQDVVGKKKVAKK